MPGCATEKLSTSPAKVLRKPQIKDLGPSPKIYCACVLPDCNELKRPACVLALSPLSGTFPIGSVSEGWNVCFLIIHLCLICSILILKESIHSHDFTYTEFKGRECSLLNLVSLLPSMKTGKGNNFALQTQHADSMKPWTFFF